MQEIPKRGKKLKVSGKKEKRFRRLREEAMREKMDQDLCVKVKKDGKKTDRIVKKKRSLAITPSLPHLVLQQVCREDRQ